MTVIAVDSCRMSSDDMQIIQLRTYGVVSVESLSNIILRELIFVFGIRK